MISKQVAAPRSPPLSSPFLAVPSTPLPSRHVVLQFSLSVHYRQVASSAHVDEVHQIVHEYVANAPEIVVKAGKKVRCGPIIARRAS